jgi:DNA repair protein RadA/Sms
MYICSNCGYGSLGFLGRCPDCGNFNTFVKKQEEQQLKKGIKASKTPFITEKLEHVENKKLGRIQTGLFEFDRVLGGGFVAGEVVLLSGEPGVGKSTLLLQCLSNVKSLYISGEESKEQIKDRAERLDVAPKHMLLSNSVELGSIVEGIKDMYKDVDIVIIDSLQTIQTEVSSSFGSTSALKEAIQTIVNVAKFYKVPVVLIGHVTKDGDIAGPKMVEHMVDAVLQLEGEEVSNYRILRATKNRFGDPGEIGVFEMQGKGLLPVNNPLAFIDEGKANSPGRSVIGVNEGKRVMFYEVQTLAVETTLPMPRRVAKGVDYNKLLLLLAIIRKYLHLPMDTYDIYVNIAGGAKITSTAADLGIIASIVSSLTGKAYSKDTVFVGEVGLLGDIKKMYTDGKVAAEAKRLGFKNIVNNTAMQNIKEIKKLGV